MIPIFITIVGFDKKKNILFSDIFWTVTTHCLDESLSLIYCFYWRTINYTFYYNFVRLYIMWNGSQYHVMYSGFWRFTVIVLCLFDYIDSDNAKY